MSKMLEGIKKINFKKYTKFLIYFWVIVLVAILVDQITKVLAMNLLSLGDPVPFIPNFIEFTLVFNKGAAFGMGDDALWIRIIFVILSWAVAVGLIVYIGFLLYKDKQIKPFFGITLALILGGDVGNLIDRTFFFDRGVVDFISIQSWFPNFGIFNIADSCLVVGVLMLVVYLIADEFKLSKAEKEHKKNIEELENKEKIAGSNQKDINNNPLDSNSNDNNGK